MRWLVEQNSWEIGDKMKKIFVFLSLLIASAAIAATSTTYDNGKMRVVTVTWSGANQTSTVSAPYVNGKYLVVVDTTPASTPDDNYDIVVNNAAGIDICNGSLANRDTTNSERASCPAAIDGALSIVITNQAAVGASGTIKLYLTDDAESMVAPGSATSANQASMITLMGAGLPAALGAGNGLKIDGSGTALPVSQNGTFIIAQGDAGTDAEAWIFRPSDGTNPLFTLTNPGVIRTVTADAADQAVRTNPPAPMSGKLDTDATKSAMPAYDLNGSGFVAASATGGATPHSFISTGSANLTSVKGSAGTLYSLHISNTTGKIQYVRLYNKATAPDPSACSSNSDCPVLYYAVPFTTSNVGGLDVKLPPMGVAFATGIGYSISGAACTVVATCTDETAADAGVTIDMSYK